ncbi:MAG: hypothetical protein QOH12_3226 [Solirubrobacteraceae bacterium]|jgi:hypothetical protein|nr:hypothetical protein [Solirubrobacteraceae bacterium]
MPRGVAVGGATLGLVTLLAVHFAERGSYWDYSEGVYALTAQLWLHGADLYGHLVAAQPPGVFVVGAGLLAVHDSLDWLRLGVGGLQLAGGVIAASIVWRMSGRRLAAVATPAAMLLTPWALHEHGALLPELVALPVLLAGLRWSVEPRRAVALGVVCGLLVLIKIPLVLAAVVLLVMCPSRRRSIVAALATLLAGILASAVLGGEGLWREVVYAQTQSGHRSLSAVAGFWAQGGWNVLGLLVAAAITWRLRGRSGDPRLVSVTAAVGLAILITFATNLKEGTSLNIAVPIEAVLLPLALTGAALAASEGARLGNRRLVIALAGLVLTLVQTGSLLISPTHPVPFLRPGSRPAWAVTETAAQLRVSVAGARACRGGLAFGGPPLIAMLAGRRMPDDQPDQFITRSPALRAVAAAMAAVPSCL